MSRTCLRGILLAGLLLPGWTGAAIAQSPILLDRDVLLESPSPREESPPGPAPAPLPEVDSSHLSPAELSYAVEMSLGGTRVDVSLERSVRLIEEGGRSCWRVVDVASTGAGDATDTFDLDAVTLAPLRREAEGTGFIRLSYGADAVTGEIGVGEDRAEIDVPLPAPIMGDGPGLDLTLAALPLRPGYTTTIRFFEPIEQGVRVMQLAVTGEKEVSVPAGTFPTWVVEITSLDGNDSGTATLAVMKEDPHFVVKGEHRLPALVGGGVMTTELTAAGTRSGSD